MFSVYFRAAGPDPDEPYLAMHSSLDAAPASSLVARDMTVAEVGMPFVIPNTKGMRADGQAVAVPCGYGGQVIRLDGPANQILVAVAFTGPVIIAKRLTEPSAAFFAE